MLRWSVETEPHKLAPAEEIIDEAEIHRHLEDTKELAKDLKAIRDILQKARANALLVGSHSETAANVEGCSTPNVGGGALDHEYVQGLDLHDAATLLNIDARSEVGKVAMQELFDTALDIKRQIYGNRIVLFAPLYLANYCVNSCTYCAFRGANHHIERSALSEAELRQEVESLQRQGHRRLLLLTGEHPKYTFDRFLDALRVVKEVRTDPCGSIRRINVEIPALSVSDFRRLKQTDCVGTYTLFQETYHRDTYKRVHPSGPKADYAHRLQTMDRAQLAGIDDVGIGALFGLHDHRFEVMALLMHARHLDKTFHAGPHTISIPRMRPADNAPDAIAPPAPVDDEDFRKLVAIIRCAVPYTGMILSTRESPAMRRELLHLGISQMSAGSKTEVGSYHKGDFKAEQLLNSNAQQQKVDDKVACNGSSESTRTNALAKEKKGQFELQDERSTEEVVRDLMDMGFLPSWCTACYRLGRTGEAFMKIAKKGDIQNFCHPNSLLTLEEYLQDYASPDTKLLGKQIIEREKMNIPSARARAALDRKLHKIAHEGKRDLYF